MVEYPTPPRCHHHTTTPTLKHTWCDNGQVLVLPVVTAALEKGEKELLDREIVDAIATDLLGLSSSPSSASNKEEDSKGQQGSEAAAGGATRTGSMGLDVKAEAGAEAAGGAGQPALVSEGWRLDHRDAQPCGTGPADP